MLQASRPSAAAAAAHAAFIVGLIVDQSPTKSLQCRAQEETQTEQLLFQIDRACEVGGEDG